MAVVVPVLVADQCLKVWVKLNFSLGERMAFIPGLLELQFIENAGMAFGWREALAFASPVLCLRRFSSGGLSVACGVGAPRPVFGIYHPCACLVFRYIP